MQTASTNICDRIGCHPSSKSMVKCSHDSTVSGIITEFTELGTKAIQETESLKKREIVQSSSCVVLSLFQMRDFKSNSA